MGNREEAKEYLISPHYKMIRGQKIATEYYVDGAEKFIDKIFDEFKSRTCENCKLSDVAEDGELYLCDLLMNLTRKQARELIHDGFGCNMFERKDK